MHFIWQAGDVRVVTAVRQLTLLNKYLESIDKPFSGVSKRDQTLAAEVLSRIEKMIDGREQQYPGDTRHESLKRDLELCRAVHTASIGRSRQAKP